jgi:hypothetical protein
MMSKRPWQNGVPLKEALALYDKEVKAAPIDDHWRNTRDMRYVNPFLRLINDLNSQLEYANKALKETQERARFYDKNRAEVLDGIDKLNKQLRAQNA